MNDYTKIVRETLIEDWGRHEWGQNGEIQQEDLAAAIELFAKIATEATGINFDVSTDTEKLRNVKKIKEFVQENSFYFRNACGSGSPFSILDKTASEAALKTVLERKRGPFLYHFMNSDTSWMSENELDECFKPSILRFQIDEVVYTCSNFKEAYLKRQDLKAGFYLLWLIKIAGDCDFEIPKKELFTSGTVAEVLTHFIEHGSLREPENLIEILQYQNGNECFYEGFLSENAEQRFMNYVIEKLTLIPMDQWKNKAEIIDELFAAVTSEGKLFIAKILATSKDPATAEIGNAILK